MAYYITREASIATEEAWTVLNGLGGTTESDPMIPGQCKAIKQIIVSATPGATAGVATISVKLTGAALLGATEHVIPAVSWGPGGTNTHNDVGNPLVIDCDIAVQGGNQLQMQAVVSGADVGTSEVAVTIAAV